MGKRQRGSRTLKVFTGTANPKLAGRIAAHLGVPLGELAVSRFSDGEINVQIKENIRGCDVYIVQPTYPPAEHLMELLIMIDAARRASADRVTAVIPYFGYARQDRKDRPRAPISAKLVANLITVAGANRVLTMDLHSAQIQGFFDIPLDHLYAQPVLAAHFAALRIPDLTVAAPDAGSIKLARAYAKRLGASLALVNKRRTGDDLSETMEIVGDVAGRNVLLVDDLISTAGTIKNAARELRRRGALDVYATCTHPCFSGPALARLKAARLKRLVVSDTIPQTAAGLRGTFKVLSVGELMGEAVLRIHESRSLSDLFD
ncbi:MAG: ribose-phosphate pyrophosphokinase [Candidatus Eisenbacteria bacterium]|uniref:Ribose-phosphate pyrophosphokinase n=1 Tax=Eiseniibacteriota bacterium TaxID=2212470 RepID=A0A937XEY4_UNCEI|nr:ribose-phosphate pyrophosphokinase [Candidatus Eisenbacteria bacterium]